MRRTVHAIAIAFAALAFAGCDRPTHENIDRWMRTEKGPAKLERAVRDGGLELDRRAHAAQNLIRTDRLPTVVEILDGMGEGDRQQILGALVPRLWEDARITGGEMAAPSPAQAAAKDALFDLRAHAGDENRALIDQYLVDWLTGGYYDGRARAGRVPGEVIIRAAGPPAGAKLTAQANRVLAAPPEGGKRLMLEDGLLLALAVSGSEEAVRRVVDLVAATHDDKTLQRRALAALHKAYVRPPSGAFPRVDGAALRPHLERLAAVLRDDALPPAFVNDGVELVVAAGMPGCLEPLVGLISYQHANPRFRWVVAQAALRCGTVEAIIPVAEALPASGAYEREVLVGAVWTEISRMEPRAEVAARARTLLESKSWIARITGVEVLGMLALRSSAEADAATVRRLASDRTVLAGWWGDQSNLPARERKREPTLGQRATEVASALHGLATGAQDQ